MRAGWARVEFGAGRAQVEKFSVRISNVEPLLSQHMNLIS